MIIPRRIISLSNTDDNLSKSFWEGFIAKIWKRHIFMTSDLLLDIRKINFTTTIHLHSLKYFYSQNKPREEYIHEDYNYF